MSKFIVSFYFVVFFYVQVQRSFMFDIFIAGQDSVKVLTGCGFVYVFSANSAKSSFLFTLTKCLPSTKTKSNTIPPAVRL